MQMQARLRLSGRPVTVSTNRGPRPGSNPCCDARCRARDDFFVFFFFFFFPMRFVSSAHLPGAAGLVKRRSACLFLQTGQYPRGLSNAYMPHVTPDDTERVAFSLDGSQGSPPRTCLPRTQMLLPGPREPIGLGLAGALGLIVRRAAGPPPTRMGPRRPVASAGEARPAHGEPNRSASRVRSAGILAFHRVAAHSQRIPHPTSHIPSRWPVHRPPGDAYLPACP